MLLYVNSLVGIPKLTRLFMFQLTCDSAQSFVPSYQPANMYSNRAESLYALISTCVPCLLVLPTPSQETHSGILWAQKKGREPTGGVRWIPDITLPKRK